jgi:hypothetical protein
MVGVRGPALGEHGSSDAARRGMSDWRVLAALRRRAATFLFCASACSSGQPGARSEGPPEVSVDIGLSSGPDGLEFEHLDAGGSVPLYTFGQGGTHALLAVRCRGLGERAFVAITIRRPADGRSVSAPAGQSPRLLACNADGSCDLLPLLVMTGGLVAPGTNRDGLAVVIRADASNLEGVSTSVEREAFLSAAAL